MSATRSETTIVSRIWASPWLWLAITLNGVVGVLWHGGWLPLIGAVTGAYCFGFRGEARWGSKS